jgi:RimJ/RimL family protein N-acetyltransferase
MLRWPEVQPTLAEAVVLRPWTDADVDEVFRACQDAEIQRYTNVPVPYLREHAEFFVGPFQATNWADRTGVGFAVTDGTDGALLGACGLIGVDLDADRSGVGYWTAPWGRGRGAASVALGLLAEWAIGQVGLLEVYAEVEEGNAASRRVAERAGFVRGDIEPRWEEHRGAQRLFLTFVRAGSTL